MYDEKEGTLTVEGRLTTGLMRENLSDFPDDEAKTILADSHAIEWFLQRCPNASGVLWTDMVGANWIVEREVN